MALIQKTFAVPFREALIEKSGLLTRTWEIFFDDLWKRLSPLGLERSASLANNQSDAANVEGLQFSKANVSCAFIDFLIQRVTTGTGAVELIEAGTLIAAYEPISESWSLAEPVANKPEDSGVSFIITASGQIQYTTTNITGDAALSRIVYRARTLSAKSALYSSVRG